MHWMTVSTYQTQCVSCAAPGSERRQPGPVLEVEPRATLAAAILSITDSHLHGQRCSDRLASGALCGGQLRHLLWVQPGRHLVFRVKRFKVGSD